MKFLGSSGCMILVRFVFWNVKNVLCLGGEMCVECLIMMLGLLLLWLNGMMLKLLIRVSGSLGFVDSLVVVEFFSCFS